VLAIERVDFHAIQVQAAMEWCRVERIEGNTYTIGRFHLSLIHGFHYTTFLVCRKVRPGRFAMIQNFGCKISNNYPQHLLPSRSSPLPYNSSPSSIDHLLGYLMVQLAQSCRHSSPSAVGLVCGKSDDAAGAFAKPVVGRAVVEELGVKR